MKIQRKWPIYYANNQQYKSVFTTPKDISDVLLKPPRNGNSLSENTIIDKYIKELIEDMAVTQLWV